MDDINRREFIKKAGIVTIGLTAAFPFFREISETAPKNNQMSFRITDQPMMNIKITAHPKKEV